MKYILDDKGEPQLATTEEWAKAFDKDRRVASDHVDDIHISTVFLGLAEDHIWETMAFDEHQEEIDRLTCGGPRANALAMHKIMLNSIIREMKYLILLLIPVFASCESASQTAMRTNQIPAVAYITSPQILEQRVILVPTR